MAEINIAKQLLAARHEKENLHRRSLPAMLVFPRRRCRSGKVV